jgi:hypothetical protein
MRLATCVLLLAACSGSDPGLPDAADLGPDAGGTIDAAARADADTTDADTTDADPFAPDADPVFPDAGGPTITETNVPVTTTFVLDAVAEGTSRVGHIELQDGVGSVEIDGDTLDAFSFEHPPEFSGYMLYHVVAARRDEVFMLWLYCQGTSLTYVYSEGTDGSPMLGEGASGTCVATHTASTITASLPALALPPVALQTGYTLTGDMLSYGGTSPGEIVFDGITYSLLPFEDVDCYTVCGSPGWYELHSLLWSSTLERLGFGVLYLFDGQPVGMGYVLFLPDGERPGGYYTFDSTWTR